MQKQLHSFASTKSNIDFKRSIFDFSPRIKTSFNQGQLVPIGSPIEVLPGDTFRFDLNAFVRMSAQPIKPVLDDAYIDIYAFFVPSRLLWQYFEEEHGSNQSSPWTQPTEYIEPQVTLAPTSSSPVLVGGLADYLGVPTGLPDGSTILTTSLLPFAAYAKIWNDWFRDENYQYPVTLDSLVYNLPNGSSFYPGTSNGLNFGWYSSGSYVSSLSSGLMKKTPLLQVNKYHDYFTSVLPSPQKGEAVSIPLGESAPLFASSSSYSLTNNAWIANLIASGSDQASRYSAGTGITTTPVTTNIQVDLSQATGATINDLRYAFALQSQYETDARAGSRYIEILKANYGVSPSDSRLQRPELLGAIHQKLGMSSVAQTSQAETATLNNGLGTLGGISATGIHSGFVNKSFEEFGFIFVLGAVRVKHSYCQGLPRSLTKKRRFDYYYPTFANIGEQPVYTQEIYGGADSGTVFGYQEAWAYLREFPDQVTGQLRKGGGYDDFAAWTYADEYNSVPVASASWLFEGAETIGNATVLGGSPANGLQFIGDFNFSGVVTRCLPVNSIPKLVDLR